MTDDGRFRDAADVELPSRLAMVHDLRVAAGLPDRDGLGPEMWAEAIEQVRAWRVAEAERTAEPPFISYAEVRARIDAEPYDYKVTPMTSGIGWYIHIGRGLMESGTMSSYGSRDRAVHKAERRIARLARRDAREKRLTVEGRVGP